MERTDPADPTPPMERTEPTDPTDKTERRDPMHRTESRDHSDHREPSARRFMVRVSTPGIVRLCAPARPLSSALIGPERRLTLFHQEASLPRRLPSASSGAEVPLGKGLASTIAEVSLGAEDR